MSKPIELEKALQVDHQLDQHASAIMQNLGRLRQEEEALRTLVQEIEGLLGIPEDQPGEDTTGQEVTITPLGGGPVSEAAEITLNRETHESQHTTTL